MRLVATAAGVLIFAAICHDSRAQNPPADQSSADDQGDDSDVPEPPAPPENPSDPEVPTRVYQSTVRAKPQVPGGLPLPDLTAVDTNQFHPTGDPITGSGEYVLTKTDLSFTGFGVPFQFTRTYRSQVQYQGPLGYGWTHNFSRRIVDHASDGTPDCAGDVYYVSDRLERIKFKPIDVSVSSDHVIYSAGADIPLQLDHFPNQADPWVLSDGNGLLYYFDSQGGLHRIQDSAGNTLVVTWDHSVPTDDGGVVTKVTDTTGRVIYFHNQIWRTEFHAWAQLQCLSLADNCNSPLVSWAESRSPGSSGARVASTNMTFREKVAA